MDHLVEAEKELDNAGGFYPGPDDNERVTFSLLLAQTHALIAIAQAVEALAGCITTDCDRYNVLYTTTHKKGDWR